MSDRDRLIQLIYNWDFEKYVPYNKSDIEELADCLLSNSVIVLPCKVGDTIYRVHRVWVGSACSYKWKLDEEIVEYIRYNGEDFSFEDMYGTIYFASEIGKTVFLTREEAEQALKERKEK